MITHSLQPDLTWELNDGSVLFQVQISKTSESNFEDSIYIDINSLDSNLFDLENFEYFLDEGTNYWRVKSANNTNAWSDWSDINQFRITGSLPQIVIDPHPDSIFTQYSTLIFNWEESLSSNSIPAIMYQIQINYNESESIMRDVIIDDIETLTYEFENLESFLYNQSYYRIRS